MGSSYSAIELRPQNAHHDTKTAPHAQPLFWPHPRRHTAPHPGPPGAPPPAAPHPGPAATRPNRASKTPIIIHLPHPPLLSKRTPHHTPKPHVHAAWASESPGEKERPPPGLGRSASRRTRHAAKRRRNAGEIGLPTHTARSAKAAEAAGSSSNAAKIARATGSPSLRAHTERSVRVAHALPGADSPPCETWSTGNGTEILDQRELEQSSASRPITPTPTPPTRRIPSKNPTPSVAFGSPKRRLLPPVSLKGLTAYAPFSRSTLTPCPI